MKNPIPSAMVYFDEKQRKAVLCIDKTLPPPAVLSACDNSSDERGFHAHTWAKLGWTTEAAFMSVIEQPKDFAATIIYEMMFAVVTIRKSFEAKNKRLAEARKTNERLEGVIRNNIAAMRRSMLFINYEEERLELARAMVNAECRVVSRDEQGEAS